MLTLNGCYSRGRIVRLVCTSCDHVNLHVEMIVVGVVIMVVGVVIMVVGVVIMVVGVVMMVVGAVMTVVLMIACQNIIVMVICW